MRYIKDVHLNEPMKIYYNHIKDTLNALFACALIAKGEVFKFTESTLAGALQSAGEVIPIVGDVLKYAGMAIGMWTEFKLQ